MTTEPVDVINAYRVTPEPYRGRPLSCPVCREELVALGYDDAAEDSAALAGPTCCVPDPLPLLGGAAGPTTATGVDRDAERPATNPPAAPVAAWVHTTQALALYVGVPVAWIAFLVALIAHIT